MKRHHLLISVLLVGLGVSYYFGYTPAVIALAFVVASVMAYWLYAKDKSAAKLGAWRISENTLHMAALCFGWPGALLAQERLRHKTSKQSFRTVFWLTVLINAAGVMWLHGSQGNQLLRQGIAHMEDFVIAHVSHENSLLVIFFLTEFRTKAID